MSFRTAVRRIVTEAFPWIERIGFTSAGDLEIKSATSKLDLAGPGLQAAHRVGDEGHAGTFSLGAAGILVLTRPDGSSFVLTFTSATPGSPVVIGLVDLGPTPGKLVSRAETGSDKVTIG